MFNHHETMSKRKRSGGINQQQKANKYILKSHVTFLFFFFWKGEEMRGGRLGLCRLRNFVFCVLIWTTSPHATFTGYKILHWTWMHTLPEVQNFWLETRQAPLSYKHPPPSSHNFHLIEALVRLISQSGTNYLGSQTYMLINLSIIHILYTFLGMSEWALWKFLRTKATLLL